jgi:hypothetical protein
MKRAPDPFPVFKPRGTPANLDGFDRSIADTADHLIRELGRAKRLPTNVKNGLKREDLHFLAYALVVHRTRNGEALTEDHLRLLAAALDLQPGRVPSRVAAFLGLPPIKAGHYLTFLRAADLDARDPEVSENKLAECVGVDRGTIRSWRKMKPYRDRVQWVRLARRWGGSARV